MLKSEWLVGFTVFTNDWTVAQLPKCAFFSWQTVPGFDNSLRIEMFSRVHVTVLFVYVECVSVLEVRFPNYTLSHLYSSSNSQNISCWFRFTSISLLPAIRIDLRSFIRSVSRTNTMKTPTFHLRLISILYIIVFYFSDSLWEELCCNVLSIAVMTNPLVIVTSVIDILFV